VRDVEVAEQGHEDVLLGVAHPDGLAHIGRLPGVAGLGAVQGPRVGRQVLHSPIQVGEQGGDGGILLVIALKELLVGYCRASSPRGRQAIVMALTIAR
jgi:hypothetical protein